MKLPLFNAHALLALLAAAVLAGCAYSPGMYVGSSLTPPVAAASESTAAQDAPPAGRLTPITPELLRQQRTSRPVDIAPDVKKLFGVPQPYLIGAGDVLGIMVWDHPELSIAAGGSAADGGSGFNVSPQGFIQFPYVGKLKLGGLTEYEARDLLTQRLAKTIKDPQLTVRIQSFRSGRVYLDGEVRTPGLQAINDVPMTLPEAIGRAGGFSPTADRSAIAISRKGVTTMVNMVQLSEQGINPASILLVNGDLVRVLAREEAKVFVLGEVSRPSTQTLRNGRLTLGEALGESGGVNPASGDPRQIFVVRAANTEQPEIYHLDARSPAAFALAEGFELQARDVVYVDPVPLVRWNRVISLILPSAQAVTTTQAVVRAGQ
jgi:polysaccharide export outer membrane protein